MPAKPAPNETDTPPLAVVIIPRETGSAGQGKGDCARPTPVEMCDTIDRQETDSGHRSPEGEEERALKRNDTNHPLVGIVSLKA